MRMRDTLFISHATPEDNEFAIWLTSRLQLAGYKVWCDLDGLIGGEKFWQTIDDQIRNSSIKFLFVISNFICSAPGKLRNGIDREYNLAESIGNKEGLDDYIIPLKIDKDTPYDYFIGQNLYNHIPFKDNWAIGLRKLIDKLDKDNVPKFPIEDNLSIVSWYENEFTTKFELFSKRERYYSNWWPIADLPEYLYIYQYDSKESANSIYQEDCEFPIINHGNTLATFTEKINTRCTKLDNLEIVPIQTYELRISDILKGFDNNDFPTLNDAENLLKWLLNRSFHLLMKRKGLYWYEMANKSLAYFYPKFYLKNNKVTFHYPTSTKTKNLVGKYKIDDKKIGSWHFAVSSRARLHPILSFSLKSHILFSDDGYNVWPDKQKLHTARRRKGKRWFNEEWRDQLMAFISALKDDRDEIELPLNKHFSIKMPTLTEIFYSNVGYNEPELMSRQNVNNISTLEEEEFYLDVEI